MCSDTIFFKKVLSVLLVLFLTPVVYGQNNISETEVKSFHIQGNIWLLQGSGGNITLQIGDDGVLVVDTQYSEIAPKILEEINNLAPGKIIRYVINTHAHQDHTGGNQIIKAAGRSFAIGAGTRDSEETFGTGAEVIAHENTMLTMATANPEIPFELWPTEVFIGEQYDFFFNGEAVLMFYFGPAHTNGDIIVYFRGSEVISAGDLYVSDSYPFIDQSNFGHINGIIDALNSIIRIAVPRHNQEGGTLIVSGHGRIADEADIVEYRDMITIIRDRVQHFINQGMSLDETLEADISRDYDGRYGNGFVSPDSFISAIYNGLAQ